MAPSNKPISIPLVTALMIISMVCGATTMYFASNNEQDKVMTNHATRLDNHDVRITDLETKMESFDWTQVAVMKAQLTTTSKNIADMKVELERYREEQQKFYRKMAAKLGFTFDE